MRSEDIGGCFALSRNPVYALSREGDVIADGRYRDSSRRNAFPDMVLDEATACVGIDKSVAIQSDMS